jgi:glycosyltransferase involved in cell wall biosynthesis
MPVMENHIGSRDLAPESGTRHSQPLVSVVLPVLNAERFLQQALASIHAQSYPNYEIVVIDGGSTDATRELAQQAARVRLMPQAGSGLANAWNTGLRAARGSYISFLESDDLWATDKLAHQVTHLEQHPNIQYVIGQVKLFLEPGCPPPAGLSPAVFEGSHVGRMPGTLMARLVRPDRRI